MSNTHDYSLGNANGLNFRNDINSVLADIQSTNSGSSSPSTTVAGKLWIDTTNNLIKLRNNSNNAWITIGSSNTANLGLASTASPSFSGTLTAAGDIVCTGTGSLQLPAGTTAQRPTGATGDLRFNSTISKVETYTGSTWESVGGVPAGSVVSFAHTTPPSGWLECNGEAISRSNFATLFAAIATTWGAGDGSSTFALPDLRGEFVRGWDHSKGTDSGRNMNATVQTDQNKSHNHSASISDPGHTHQGRGLTLNNIFGGVAVTLGSGQSYTVGYRNDNVNFSNANTSNTTGISLSGGVTDNQGGTEVRVRNIAMMYIIKY